MKFVRFCVKKQLGRLHGTGKWDRMFSIPDGVFESILAGINRVGMFGLV